MNTSATTRRTFRIFFFFFPFFFFSGWADGGAFPRREDRKIEDRYRFASITRGFFLQDAAEDAREDAPLHMWANRRSKRTPMREGNRLS
jgi:hypothetical protein